MNESTPSWPYTIDGPLVASLRRIDRGLGAISRAPLLPRLRQRLQKEARRRSSKASAGIEGVLVDDAALQAIEEGGEPTTRSEREVAALVGMYEWIGRQPSGCVITEDDCRSLHKMVFKGVIVGSMTGRYRKEPVYIWERGVVAYEAPPASEVPGLMRSFGAWLTGLQDGKVHPVLAAGIAQYEFVRIHPFMDGNGRSSRGLSALVLRSFDSDAGGLLVQEQQMLDRLEEFYRAIEASDKGREMTPWLQFYCQTLADEVVRVVREVDLLNRDLALPGESPLRLNDRQQVYLHILRTEGSLRTARGIQETGSSQATFFRDMAALIRTGVVVAEGATKARLYSLRRAGDGVETGDGWESGRN